MTRCPLSREFLAFAPPPVPINIAFTPPTVISSHFQLGVQVSSSYSSSRCPFDVTVSLPCSSFFIPVRSLRLFTPPLEDVEEASRWRYSLRPLFYSLQLTLPTVLKQQPQNQVERQTNLTVHVIPHMISLRDMLLFKCVTKCNVDHVSNGRAMAVCVI